MKVQSADVGACSIRVKGGIGIAGVDAGRIFLEAEGVLSGIDEQGIVVNVAFAGITTSDIGIGDGGSTDDFISHVSCIVPKNRVDDGGSGLQAVDASALVRNILGNSIVD